MHQGSDSATPRQAILRGVYEQNRQLNGGGDGVAASVPAPASTVPADIAPARRHRRGWWAALPLVALAAAGLLTAQRPVETGPRSAALTATAVPALALGLADDGRGAAAAMPTAAAAAGGLAPAAVTVAVASGAETVRPDAVAGEDELVPAAAAGNQAGTGIAVAAGHAAGPAAATAPPAESGAPPELRTALPPPALQAGALPAGGLSPRLLASGAPPAPPAPRLDLAAVAAPLLRAELPLKSIFGLGVRTIVIDPGHGGRDPGTSGRLGTREKDVTLDVALRLKRLLERDRRYRVLLTRAEDRHVSLSERVKMANRSAADLFVSIHVNYLPNTTLNVVETYYFGPHSDAQALERARLENRVSDYSLSDFEELMRGMRDTIKLQESRVLAQSIQTRLSLPLVRAGERTLDVGIKSAPFVVLLGVEAPAVLSEISCMSSPEAEEKLRTPSYREEIAGHLAAGINDYLNDNSEHGGGTDGPETLAEKS